MKTLLRSFSCTYVVHVLLSALALLVYLPCTDALANSGKAIQQPGKVQPQDNGLQHTRVVQNLEVDGNLIVKGHLQVGGDTSVVGDFQGQGHEDVSGDIAALGDLKASADIFAFDSMLHWVLYT